MSDNIDALLDGEDEVDYEIGDDEENALLDDDDGFDEEQQQQGNEDILDLGTTNEDDELENHNLMDEVEYDERSRSDKFSLERAQPAQNHTSNDNNNRNMNQGRFNNNNNQFRGRGGRGRGGFGNQRGNHQNRQYHNQNQITPNRKPNQPKMVHVNPRFHQKVANNNNGPMGWGKKPIHQVQPWAHNQPQQWQQHTPQINNYVPQQQYAAPPPQQFPPIYNEFQPPQNQFQSPQLHFQAPPHQYQSPPQIHPPPIYQQPPPPQHFQQRQFEPNYEQPARQVFTQFQPTQNIAKPPVHQRLGFNNPPPVPVVVQHQFEQERHVFQQNTQMPPPYVQPAQNIQVKLQSDYNNHSFNNYQEYQAPPQYSGPNNIPPYFAPPINQYEPPMYQQPPQQQQHPVQYQEPQQQMGPPPLMGEQMVYQVKNAPNYNNDRNIPVNNRFVNNNDNKVRGIQRTSPIKRKSHEGLQSGYDGTKRRSTENPNLYTVPVLDTPTFNISTKPTIVEEESEAAKEYREKIEGQKRERERFLANKEKNRLAALKAIQSGQPTTQPTVKTPQPAPIIKKTPVIQRIVKQPIVKHSSVLRPVLPQQEEPDEVGVSAGHISSFLTNRKIFAKDDTLADTSAVIVSNLSAGTTEIKLRKLCQGVGDVQTFDLSATKRQATIVFKSVASAHAFYKKYQRFMLDLSMIQVILKPEL